MKYLSLDIEATGLDEHDLIIEFAVVPFSTDGQIEESLSFHKYVQCPSFEELKPKLNKWVIDNNEKLITKAHKEGIPLSELKVEFEKYLKRPEVQSYFFKDQSEKKSKDTNKIVLFGKSMNAIDLPFLNRDLGWNFMREYFHHQVLDLSSFVRGMVDSNKIPEESKSGSGLMKFLGMGDVAHTAKEDAINTAKMYQLLLKKFT